MRNSKSRSRALCVAVLSTLLAVSACTSRIATHGNLPDPERLAEVKPGEMAKDEVAEILGSPSSKSMFGEETWYYISERKETTAFFKPELTERKVLIVRFDKEGYVSALETLGAEDGREIDPVERKTPTAGNEITILQQLLGNFGKYTDSTGAR